MGPNFAGPARVHIPMTLIARILRFLFWMLVLSWSVGLVRRLAGSLGIANHARPQADVVVPPDAMARKLVRDPICGVYMAESIAVPLGSGNQLVHFCSADCRDKYVESSQKLAANA